MFVILQILCVELRALRSACLKIASAIGAEYKPGITFLVVQKRHHTRFFPDQRDGDGGRNNNVLAGTVVDREITHPTELDFYLVSHQSIQVYELLVLNVVVLCRRKRNSQLLTICNYFVGYGQADKIPRIVG